MKTRNLIGAIAVSVGCLCSGATFAGYAGVNLFGIPVVGVGANDVYYYRHAQRCYWVRGGYVTSYHYNHRHVVYVRGHNRCY